MPWAFFDNYGNRKASQAGPATTYRKSTQKVVASTTAATDLLNSEITIAANAMGATGVVRLEAFGDYKQNSGATTNAYRFQLVFGGTTLFDTGAPGFALDNLATRYGWSLKATIANLNATNSQVCIFEMHLGTHSGSGTVSGAFTTGVGVYIMFLGASGGVVAQAGPASTTAALDTTASKTLVLNVINPANSASCDCTLSNATVEIL